TLELVVLAFLFALAVAIPLGVLAALHRARWIDQLSRIIAVMGLSIPGFWLGLLLIRFVSLELGWLPPGGFVALTDSMAGNLRTMILPAFALGVYQIAVISRMMRSSMLDVLS